MHDLVRVSIAYEANVGHVRALRGHTSQCTEASLEGWGRTAPGDTLHWWHPSEKNVCGRIYKEWWTNEVGQVKKVRGDTLQGGDTRVSEIYKSDSDEQKRSSVLFQEKIGVTPWVVPPRVTPTLVTPLPVHSAQCISVYKKCAMNSSKQRKRNLTGDTAYRMHISMFLLLCPINGSISTNVNRLLQNLVHVNNVFDLLISR